MSSISPTFSISQVDDEGFRRWSGFQPIPFSAKSSKSSFDWRLILSFLKKNEPLWLHIVGQGRVVLRRLMWKHYFAPIDTSNALAWLNMPANLVLPSRPIINCLPDELLIRIFSFVVHSDCRTPQDRHTKTIRCAITSGSSPTTPLMLGHVCAMWRDLVNGSPILWSTVVVCSPEEKHIALAVYWLEKTRSCPLNLSLEQYVSPNPICDAIAHLFVAQAHRWKRVSFILVNEAPFSRLQPHDVPLLEEFRLRLEHWNTTRLDRFVQVLHSSPALKSANWGRSLSNRILLETPWTQLIDISFHSIELSQPLFDALAQCRDLLKTLQLRRMRCTQTLVSPLVFHHLERLVCEYPQGGSSIFDSFVLPRLADLQIATQYPLPWEPPTKDCVYSSIIAMIERSACIVKTLAINDFALPFLSRTSVFLKVDTLDILSAVNEDSHFVRLMTKVDGQDPLFPNLQHLSLENCQLRDGLLAEMLSSRKQQLQSVRVCLVDCLHRQDRMTMDWLRRDGVTVDIHQPISCFQIFNQKIQIAGHNFARHDIVTVNSPDYEKSWVFGNRCVG